MNRWNVALLRRNAFQSQVTSGFNSRFWEVQVITWLSYGCVLMVPWIGEYTISIMAPTKFVIAATGLLVSTMLRELYRPLLSDRASTSAVWVGLGVLLGSVSGGLVWHQAIVFLLGSSEPLDGLRAFGVFEGGTPGLSGAAYHGLVLFAWSSAYLAAGTWQIPTPPRPSPAPLSGQIVARDGKRSIVLDTDRIDWIEAAGDYVRIHIGERKLLLRSTMGRLEKSLAGRGHVRIHRSTIVNAKRIQELIRRPNNQFDVRLVDGITLRSSRSYSAQLERVVGLERVETDGM